MSFTPFWQNVGTREACGAAVGDTAAVGAEVVLALAAVGAGVAGAAVGGDVGLLALASHVVIPVSVHTEPV